jgi:hypothetical protein
MGRKTSATTYKGREVYMVPVLLECQNRMDAGDLETILRRAGYLSVFHWPQEILEFERCEGGGTKHGLQGTNPLHQDQAGGKRGWSTD